MGSQTYPHVNAWIDVNGDGVDELWVPDCSFTRTGKWSWRTGGLVYFKRGTDPTREWTKYRAANPPEVGRPVLSMDIDRDGDLDIVSGSDHINSTASLVWWENMTIFDNL